MLPSSPLLPDPPAPGRSVQAAQEDFAACLDGIAAGEPTARNRLFVIVYAELRSLASSHLLKERANHTLQSTALVHEAWLKLIEQERFDFREREHFLAVASKAMRRILVDHARAHQRAKRGGGWRRVAWEEANEVMTTSQPELDLLTVDQALSRLRSSNEHLARIAEMRLFGGLELEEIAATVGVSRATLFRQWRAARALLSGILRADDAPAG